MVSSAIGVTWEYIDQYMTLPRLYAYFEHWEDSRPVHIAVAAFLGAKRKGKGKKGRNPEEMDRLMADFGAAGFQVKGSEKSAKIEGTPVDRMIADLVAAGCKPK